MRVLFLLAVAAWFVLAVSAAPIVFDEEDIRPASVTSTAMGQEALDGDDTEGDDDFQKLFVEEAMKRHMIIDQYIVVFHTSRVSNATLAALRLIEEYGDEGTAEILWSFHAVFPGVTMRGVNTDMVLDMFDDPDVDYIEPVSEVCRQRFSV